jgi:hypothetical protein
MGHRSGFSHSDGRPGTPRWKENNVKFRLSLVLASLLCCALIAPLAAEEKSAPKKSPTHPAAGSSKKKQPQTQTAPAPSPEKQTQGGVTVQENYYLDLPGFDLSTLTPKQKEKFLKRVNSELCTCGCQNDTIARCLVNDPKCPVVRGLAEKIFSEVKAGD